MSVLQLVRRVFVFSLVFALPFAAVGFAAASERGALAGVVLAAILILAVALRAESGILRAYRVKAALPAGLDRSLERVIAQLGGAAPRVLCFSDPCPQALVVRGPASRGVILLSQGLLGSMSEEALRELLRESVLRLRRRGIVFQSVCAWLAHLSFGLAPGPWLRLLFGELRWHEDLGVFGAMRFFTIFSLAKFFMDLGRLSGTDATRRLPHPPSVLGELANPGSCILHFSDPWSSRALFPL